MLLGIFAVSRDIILLIGNTDYLSRESFWGSDWTLNLLVVAMFFAYLGIVFEFLLIALGKQKRLLIINFSGVLVNLILNFIFIPIYGIIAAAATSIICELLIMALKMFFTKKDFKDFSLNLSKNYKMLFSAGLMSIFAFYLKEELGFFPCVIGSAVLYFFLIFITRAISKDFLLKILK